MTLLHSGEIFYFGKQHYWLRYFDMILPAQCYDVEKGHIFPGGGWALGRLG